MMRKDASFDAAVHPPFKRSDTWHPSHLARNLLSPPPTIHTPRAVRRRECYQVSHSACARMTTRRSLRIPLNRFKYKISHLSFQQYVCDSTPPLRHNPPHPPQLTVTRRAPPTPAHHLSVVFPPPAEPTRNATFGRAKFPSHPPPIGLTYPTSSPPVSTSPPLYVPEKCHTSVASPVSPVSPSSPASLPRLSRPRLTCSTRAAPP